MTKCGVARISTGCIKRPRFGAPTETDRDAVRPCALSPDRSCADAIGVIAVTHNSTIHRATTHEVSHDLAHRALFRRWEGRAPSRRRAFLRHADGHVLDED